MVTPANDDAVPSGEENDGGTIVYVMGYGRSGSTLLDVALGNCPGAVGLGALCNLPEWIDLGRSCSCGSPVTACPLWGDVIERAKLRGREATLLELQNYFESPRAIPRWSMDCFDDAREALYAGLLDRLFGAVEEVTGQTTFIDSSKSARDAVTRVLALQRFSGRTIRAVHLLRHPSAVVWSDHKRAGSPERRRRRLPATVRAAKTGLQWSLTNLMCRVVRRRLGEERVISVRYEDLMRSPRDEIRRIADHIGLDGESVGEAMATGGELLTGHKLGGNRLRYDERIRIQPDFEWERKMPVRLRWITRAFTGPVSWLWGYS